MAWQVPSWLQPPSEAERRQLEAMEEQVRAKATSMLRKNVGMARMQSEAARLVQTGMDEPTARKKALLDNASLIFADNPEAVARIMQTEESNAIQERAAASLERWRNAQTEDRLRDSQFTPGFGTATNPVTQQPEAFFRTSPNSAQLVRPGSEAQSPLGRLLEERDAAEQAGDSAKVAQYDAEISSRRSRGKLKMVTNPDGTVTVEQGGESDLTTANKTRTQTNVENSLQTIDIANQLEPLLSGETVGVKAWAERMLKDRVLAQFFPGVSSPERASAEVLVSELRAKVVNELGTPPISDRERQEILRAVPGVNEPIDSPENARKMLKELRKASAVRAVIAADKLGQGVPKGAAQVLDAQELKRLVDTGALTPQQALRAYDAR